MREYFTEAIVLGGKPSGRDDKIVDLYTRDFGRLRAQVVGGKKTASKLSPHLDAGNWVAVRLVRKNRFTVADAMVKNRFSHLRKDPGSYSFFLEVVFLLRSLSPEEVPDLRFWHSLLLALKRGRVANTPFLKFLGYNPVLASCDDCREKSLSHFSVPRLAFLCRNCAARLISGEKGLIRLTSL